MVLIQLATDLSLKIIKKSVTKLITDKKKIYSSSTSVSLGEPLRRELNRTKRCREEEKLATWTDVLPDCDLIKVIMVELIYSVSSSLLLSL